MISNRLKNAHSIKIDSHLHILKSNRGLSLLPNVISTMTNAIATDC